MKLLFSTVYNLLNLRRFSIEAKSGLFDKVWYLQNYPDANQSGLPPLIHYVTVGGFQGYSPSSKFDAKSYLDQNPDVAAAVSAKLTTPLLHYLEFGVQEGRSAPRHAFDGNNAKIHIAPVYDQNLDFYDQMKELKEDDILPELEVETFSIPKSRIKSTISIDIWDTLLRRDCHPDEIKIQTTRYFYLHYYSSIRPNLRDINALFRVRLTSEQSVSKGGNWEFRLADALKVWIAASTYGTPRSIDAVVNDLMEHELSAEIKATRPDLAMLGFLSKSNLNPFYISDFYADRNFLDTVLKKNGFHGIRRGYVSSEHYKTKRQGDLFKHILDEQQIQPSEWLHIGDNLESDFRVPIELGIDSLQFKQTSEERRTSWYAKGLQAKLSSDNSVHTQRLLSLVQSSKVNKDSISMIGRKMTPIALGFALFILEEAIKGGHQEIFFFTREGQFLAELCKLIIAADPFCSKYPTVTVLEVSRRSTFAASLNDLSIASLMRLWTMYGNQSIQGLTASLSLDPSIVKPIAIRAGLSWTEKINSIWQNPKVKKLINNKAFRLHAVTKINEQRSNLSTYLKQSGFLDGVPTTRFVVDIGWRGTIQDNIAIATETSIDGCYFGLFKFLNPQPKFGSKCAWLFDDNLDDRPQSMSDVAVLEMTFNGTGGTVDGYNSSGKRVTAVRTIVTKEEEVVQKYSRPVQGAILDAIPEFVEYVRLHGLTSSDFKPIARLLVFDTMRKPAKESADAFMRLSHNETFGTGSVDHVSISSSDLSTTLKEHDSKLHASLQKCLGDSRWPAALASSSIFSKWWKSAELNKQASVPSAIFSAASPYLIKHLGDRVNVFAPASLKGSGGHRTIYNVARAISTLGFKVECFVDGRGDGMELVEQWLGGNSAAIHSSWHGSRSCSLALATVAQSAKWVADMPSAKNKGYLVQDLEAYFNPASDNFLMAENSYALGLRHYTIGNWITRVLTDIYKAEAYPSGLGADTKQYYRKPSIKREKAVCFLYQPDKPRRLPQTAISALKLVKAAMPECNIYVYGSDIKANLGFPATQLGLVNNLVELNDLYNKCSVGLCVSMTNPSRIPYEMMAAGCVPVDIYRHNNLLDHTDDTVSLAYQSEASIALAILNLLCTEEKVLAKRRQSCADLSASRTLEWESDRIANLAAAQIAGLPFEPVYPRCLYQGRPIIAKSEQTQSVDAFCNHQKQLAT
jgi:O-antigen biosynthesis protein